MHSLGIREDRNRVRIGIASEQVVPQVESFVTASGLPLDAVVIEQAEPTWSFGPLSPGASVPRLQSPTLSSVVRPLVGGVRINYHPTPSVGPGGCTLGFNVDGLDSPAFVTASHCTWHPGSTGSTAFYQSDWGTAAHEIGEELLDPSTFTGGTCPMGKVCREADAALVEHQTSGPDWAFGDLARTASSGQWSGSTSITGEWLITGRRNVAIMGQWFEKVGATTGWTMGGISATCDDIEEPHTGHLLLCQAKVNAGANQGDSGAPVFRQEGSKNVSLAGVLWGGAPNDHFAFSTLSRLEDHFGMGLDVVGHSMPTPPLISLMGSELIEPDATCTWWVDVSGGTSPFTYKWWNNGQLVSITDHYTGGKLPGHPGVFTLEVQVWDDWGQLVSDDIVVTEDSSAPACVIWP